MNIDQIFKYLFDNRRYEDLYILSRYTYRLGEPIIDDNTYELVQELIESLDLCKEYRDRSYDNDPEPRELLEEFDLLHLSFKGSSFNEDMLEYLDSDKSMSIRALEDYKEAFDYFNSVRGQDLYMSIKGDGNYTKTLYKQNTNRGCLENKGTSSRGRKGEALNLSKRSIKMLPKTIPGDMNHVLVYAECVVDKSKYKTIPRAEGMGTFKSPKTAAFSMLRVDVPEEYYKYLRYYAFNADGLDTTISGTIEKLKDMGFRTMPGELIKAEEVPTDYEEFCAWLENKMGYFYEIGNKFDIKSDGLVVDVNDKNYIGSISNQYTSRNCALKFDYWGHNLFRAVIKDIVLEQQRVVKSLVILIEPVTTDDDCEASRVTGYNLDYLIKNNLKIGSTIYFERNSGAINVLVTGERLRKRLDKESILESKAF